MFSVFEWQVVLELGPMRYTDAMAEETVPVSNEVILEERLTEDDRAFYAKWAELLDWMRAYADEHDGVLFEKEADFTDYIYRMSRPYDLPTTIMSASLSDPDGKPVLLLNASPRHAVFKEAILHPFESHTYRTLRYYPPKEALAEGKRVFTQTMLNDLADELFGFSH
ncbi:MAG: NADH-quinone oxidoreductase subunit 15 [Deinococcota bacterium]